MRLPQFLVVMFLSLTGATACLAASPAAPEHDAGVAIRVDPAGFGGASPEAIEAVLYSVADALLSRHQQPQSLSIAVSHTDGNPIALYDRSPDGAYFVRLHASGSQWHLYVYEFAHELCHVASNHGLHVAEDTTKHNQWFEEALCETASLFTLKSLAETWRQSPPAPELAGQDRNLARFLDLLLGEQHRRLPDDMSMTAWLRDNQDALRRDPYQREMNDQVASALLPLFVQNPEGWQALAYLNLDPADVRDSLDEYLRHWRDNAPKPYQVFVSEVLQLFSLDSRDGTATLQIADASHLPARH